MKRVNTKKINQINQKDRNIHYSLKPTYCGRLSSWSLEGVEQTDKKAHIWLKPIQAEGRIKHFHFFQWDLFTLHLRAMSTSMLWYFHWAWHQPSLLWNINLVFLSLAFLLSKLTFLDALASLKMMWDSDSVSDVFKISRLQSIREYCRLLQSVTECYRVLQSSGEY